MTNSDCDRSGPKSVDNTQRDVTKDAIVWLVSNNRKFVINWFEFKDKIKFNDKQSVKSVANNSQVIYQKPNHLGIYFANNTKNNTKNNKNNTKNNINNNHLNKGFKSINNEIKTKAKRKRNKNLLNDDIVCLIARFDANITLKYLDIKNEMKETTFELTNNMTINDKRVECMVSENNLYLKSSEGIYVHFGVNNFRNKSSLQVYIGLNLDSNRLQRSAIFANFSRLSEPERYSYDSCIYLTSIPLNYSYLCPHKQLFRIRRDAIRLEISNLFVEAFRRTRNKRTINPIFNCSLEMTASLDSAKESDPKRELLENSNYDDVLICLTVVEVIFVFIIIGVLVVYRSRVNHLLTHSSLLTII